MKINFDAKENSKEKASQKRCKMFEEQIRRAISTAISTDLYRVEPYASLITVTRVSVTKDFKKADVYVSAIQPVANASGSQQNGQSSPQKPAEEIDGAAIMEKHKSKLRGFLAKSTETRSCPELKFIKEASLANGQSIIETSKKESLEIKDSDV